MFVGSEIYRASSYGGAHPLRVPRVSTVMDLCRAMGWFDAGQVRTSPRAKPAALHLWHDADYIAALQQAEDDGVVSDAVRVRYGLGTVANPVFAQMFRRPATSAGGTMLAAELVRDGGVVHVPGGGTHHGLRGRANGFCYLNDPVLGMLVLRRAGIRRIAYVDIDAHHPDGVETAFHGDPDMLMISVHEERRWPFTGTLGETAGGTAFNLPVPRGFNDTEMQMVLDRLILPKLKAFRPEAIVLQCGADAVEEDPLSRLCLSNNAHWRAVAALQPLSPRFIVLGGGGYNPWSVARLWTGVWATLNGIDIPGRLPPAAETVLRGLAWTGHSRGRNPPEHWFTTLRDAPRDGAVRPVVADRITELLLR